MVGTGSVQGTKEHYRPWDEISPPSPPRFLVSRLSPCTPYRGECPLQVLSVSASVWRLISTVPTPSTPTPLTDPGPEGKPSTFARP